MAKPGRDARELREQIANGGGAKDLSRLKMGDEEALAATEMLEHSLGLRCDGCGRRVGRGFVFVSIAVKEERPVMKLSACSREDCGYATLCRVGATYVEQREYVWLDPAGIDAPPSSFVVERNRKREEKAQAEAAGPEAREDRAAQAE